MNLDIRFDFQRRERLGFIEAIWGQDKSIDQLKRLSENVLGKNEVVFITRINSEKANDLLDLYDDARFHEEANCLIIGKNLNKINTNKEINNNVRIFIFFPILNLIFIIFSQAVPQSDNLYLLLYPLDPIFHSWSL